MCNHYRADADWRERMDDWSETKVRIRFDPARPRATSRGRTSTPAMSARSWLPRATGSSRRGRTGASCRRAPRSPGPNGSKTRRGCNNARGEEADKKWPFVFVAKSGRCLIPGEAFFEWDDGPVKGKTEYRFARPDGRPFFFAGLCGMAAASDAGEILTYTMVTKAAGGDTASIGHPRQPIVLRPDELDAWMDPANPVAAFAQTPDPAGTFTLQAVKGPKAMA
jgi:putative SOS response-associated peptidase YedK